ncbi:MAG: C4-type zinc ribbon domain-containing protein [Thermodesulfobacteriota bacterium]
MKETIDQLIALQEIDLLIDSIDKKIDLEQNELDEQTSALAQHETEISEFEEKITNLEKERRTLELEVSEEMAHVKDRQSKMMQVQTGREQTALLKEIEDGKKGVKEKEELIVSIMEEVETLTTTIKEQSNLLKSEKKLLGEETEKVEASIAGINKSKKTKTNKRTRQAKTVEAVLLQKYDLLRNRRNGLAVVNVLQGVCQGCFMAIPPQRFNMLLKGDQLFDCPTCQRIMYHRAPDSE